MNAQDLEARVFACLNPNTGRTATSIAHELHVPTLSVLDALNGLQLDGRVYRRVGQEPDGPSGHGGEVAVARWTIR